MLTKDDLVLFGLAWGTPSGTRAAAEFFWIKRHPGQFGTKWGVDTVQAAAKGFDLGWLEACRAIARRDISLSREKKKCR